ncbi:tetratricopeptide repeat protein [Gardnerella vaginalis JCP8151A]|nr:tetratricopeptide repeat protein [Gardnerella vaginalis JCP8151A]
MLSVSQLYKELDSMFANHASAQEIEKYLLNALNEANCEPDESQEPSQESNQAEANAQALQLSVLNELMGFYRSRGEHTKNKQIIDNALDLARKMDLAGSEAGTTTFINAATSLRAAGSYERATEIYSQAIKESSKTLKPNDRKLAALHNNLSMLYSETGKIKEAIDQLEKALDILQKSSIDPSTDIDIAATHTNLALAIFQECSQNSANTNSKYASLNSAFEHASASIRMYIAGNNQNQPHYASALAGYAQVQYARKEYSDAVDAYSKALDLIAQCYGKDSESYAITLENLQQVQKAAEKFTASGVADAIQCAAEKSPATDDLQPKSNKTIQSNKTKKAEDNPKIKNGMQLSKEYWQTYGKQLLELPKFRDYKNRIAAGLVGHGSECYGFDDEISRDHDFGPGFCLWLTDEDYAKIGYDLQAAYNDLPQEFAGFGSRKETPRAKSCESSKRVGVFSISEFFENITGFATAPSQDEPHLWLSLSEPTLAAATNGQIFADPLGEFSKTRQSFKLMPDDVRISLISRRLGMMAQAGQYNVPRMLARKDGAAAWLSINEFVRATASIVFLLNNPISAGYLPYYKWQFAALRKLSARMASRLSGVANQLESLMRLSSAACFGGIGFGEGTKGSSEAESKINEIIQNVCNEVVQELKYQGLSDCNETFLEWQRPYVEAHINSRAACLRSL